MSDTTSILDLPTDPAGGNNNANVNIQASEMSKQAPTSMTLDQMTINQIVKRTSASQFHWRNTIAFKRHCYDDKQHNTRSSYSTKLHSATAYTESNA
jgi:hypothetical protein